MTQSWPLPQARHSKRGPRHRAPAVSHPGRRRLVASAGAALSTAVILAATVTGTAVAPGAPRVDAAGPSWVDVPPRLDPGWGQPSASVPAGQVPVWVPVRAVAERTAVAPGPAWAPAPPPTRSRVAVDRPPHPGPPERTPPRGPRPTSSPPPPTAPPAPEPSGCSPDATP